MNKKNRIILINLVAFLTIVLLILIYSAIRGERQEKSCSSFSYMDCPNECAVCPPCSECSSISCQAEKFCENIGFNKSWYEEIKKV